MFPGTYMASLFRVASDILITYGNYILQGVCLFVC